MENIRFCVVHFSDTDVIATSSMVKIDRLANDEPNDFRLNGNHYSLDDGKVYLDSLTSNGAATNNYTFDNGKYASPLDKLYLWDNDDYDGRIVSYDVNNAVVSGYNGDYKWDSSKNQFVIQ